MKTQQEIEKMVGEIQKDIGRIKVRMLTASNEFEFNTFLDDKIKKVAQYNILLEVLA